MSDHDRDMHQSYCLICFLATKKAHTFDLRFRHKLHAASVCLRFSFEDWVGPGVVRSVVVDSGGGIGIVMAVGNDRDNGGGGKYMCKKPCSSKLAGIESASTLPGNVG
jgi:hypothetical protein